MTIREFFAENPEVAVAFSGGVDSAWLLHEAVRYAGRCTAYFVSTPFQPAFELADAWETATLLGAELRVIKVDILAVPEVANNPENRCYFCKKHLFSAIMQAAKEDGYSVILDGTNASDDADDRPGMVALQEMNILSPLRLCGITKAQVRENARLAKLPVWEKPSYACLATRIPNGMVITGEDLTRVERGETLLMEMGFFDFRLRLKNGGVLQVTASQQAMAKVRWNEIKEQLAADFPGLQLDDMPRVSREN